MQASWTDIQDACVAIDRLRVEAPAHGLDLSRTVVVAHSAGGHLALWASARSALPTTSPVHAPRRSRPAVISLAGIGDLERFARFVPLHCGPGILERLAPSERLPEVSPAILPPPDAPVVMVSGVLARLVPPYVTYDYARARRGKPGGAVRLVNIPEAGHFDLVTPGTPAWEEVRRLIEAALGIGSPARLGVNTTARMSRCQRA